MNPNEYHKALEELVAQHPVAMSAVIQAVGFLPDGEDDHHRLMIHDTVKQLVEGMP